MRWMWEVGTRAYRRQSTYRGATIAGVFTNTVFGFILAYVLLAVYQQRSEIGGFTSVDAVTFTFVMQGMLMVIGAFGTTAIADRIRTGDVVSDLYRPVDFQAYWLADFYGQSFFYAIFRGIPPFVVGSLVFDLRLPGDAGTWRRVRRVRGDRGRRLLRLGLPPAAHRVLAARRTRPEPDRLAHRTVLRGCLRARRVLPGVARLDRQRDPFPSMAQLPVEVFLGKHHGFGLAGVYAVQLLWAGILLGGGRLLLHAAMRKVVVQGG